MTTTIEQWVEARREQTPPPQSFTADISEWLEGIARQASSITWPSTVYREDPARFFREVLGVEPWSRQLEIIEAIRDHKRVAVRSGHKISKSHTAAGIALWFYCSFPDARVVMTSTTARQVDQILWRELRMMVARSGRCVTCKSQEPNGERPCPHSTLIDGSLGELARTGLKSSNFREIVGFTAREAEAVAGVSGANLLYIVDEASGVADAIFEAIEGNRAGGARIALFGNPTRNEGEHFEAFYGKSELYRTITVSSEETPNVVEGREVIPGLAGREWIEEKKREWGAESALFKVRVEGEHALREDGKIFSIHAIAMAESRWEETTAEGRLYIGLDPSGESGLGDEAAFAARRGLKLLRLDTRLGLDPAGHLAYLLGLIQEMAVPREAPVVVLDVDGAVGARVSGTLKGYLDGQAGKPFELVCVRSADRAVRQSKVYDRLRDELTANLESWVRDGGAIPEDVKLAKEMHAFEWQEQVNGRLKVVPPKKLLRRKEYLGRSPDRYDALALSCWEPLALMEEAPPSAKKKAARAAPRAEVVFDPYSGGFGG